MSPVRAFFNQSSRNSNGLEGGKEQFLSISSFVPLTLTCPCTETADSWPRQHPWQRAAQQQVIYTGTFDPGGGQSHPQTQPELGIRVSSHCSLLYTNTQTVFKPLSQPLEEEDLLSKTQQSKNTFSQTTQRKVSSYHLRSHRHNI